MAESSESTENASAIIVTIEGLGTNLVGCYGSAICPTPHWDRMAASGIVADQFWMDACDTHTVLESLWSGTHYARRRNAAHENAPNQRRAIQSPGLVVTDDPQVPALAGRFLDGEVLLVDPPIDGSFAFGHLLSRAISEWLPRINTHPWLWIHSRGLAAPWDAPYDYRLTMCDEGDPNPPESDEPPEALLDASTDPDVVFGWVCGAGGQAIAMDEAWEWISTMIRDLKIEAQCLLILAGIQGYPLGEHLSVGWQHGNKQVVAPQSSSRLENALSYGTAYAERLHAPLLLRPGTSLPAGIRFSPFLQPHHLAPLIESWIENNGLLETASRSHALSNGAICVDDLIALSGVPRHRWHAPLRSALALCGNELALMLPSWSARWSKASDEFLRGELFVLPDDRWQQNEVGSRAPDVLEAMSTIRDAWLTSDKDQGAEVNQLLQQLDPSLWKPVR